MGTVFYVICQKARLITNIYVTERDWSSCDICDTCPLKQERALNIKSLFHVTALKEIQLAKETTIPWQKTKANDYKMTALITGWFPS